MDRNLTVFALVLIVAIAGLVLSGTPTGAALQIIEMREYRSFAEGLCPDPRYPVPVIRPQAANPGTTAKQTLVACVEEGTIISTGRTTFYPEFNRKRDRFAYGHEKLSQL